MPASVSAPNARFLDATQYSVSWFWKRLQSDELNMQPPYQRNLVWQWEQKAFLIDSIINGFPVPELYIQTTTSSDGDEVHTIVDGQQRISACMEFLADQYALGDSTPEFEGKYFSDLSDELRGLIFRYKFVVRALPELTVAEVRDIFGRLNRNNVALNRQELRRSTYWGGFITAMEEFSLDPFWLNSGLFTSNDFRRMLDIEYISEVVSAGLYGIQNKKDRLDSFYAMYESEFPDVAYAKTVFVKVIAQLQALFDWPSRTRWSRKVDFYTLFVELWQANERLPLGTEDLAEVKNRLVEFSDGVTRVLAYAEDSLDEAPDPAFVVYARGVRNSSDLGSRRLRSRGFRSYIWQSHTDNIERSEADSPINDLLANLPNMERLLGESTSLDQNDEDDDDE